MIAPGAVRKGFRKEENTMVFKRITITASVVLIILGSALSVQAQESASIQATATVIAGIVITGEHNLIFGTVLPGIDKSVDKSDVGFAGEWEIHGNNSAEITLDFILPDSLIHTDSVAYLRINFNNTDASYDDGSGGGQTNPVAEINPNGPNTLNLGVTGYMNVWIGGIVQPTISQTGGDYSADVTLSVAYTGN
jgi:uncharacterized membrane protein